MKAKSGVLQALLAGLAVLAIALLFCPLTRLEAQEEILQATSDVQALRELAESFRMYGTGPFDSRVARMLFPSPDDAALDILDDAARDAATDLRSVTDLLAVYDNMQCSSDRATVKRLLGDRVRLYSHLLSIYAEKAAIPLGQANLPATTKKALKLRDDLIAAKNKLDAITASRQF